MLEAKKFVQEIEDVTSDRTDAIALMQVLNNFLNSENVRRKYFVLGEDEAILAAVCEEQHLAAERQGRRITGKRCAVKLLKHFIAMFKVNSGGTPKLSCYRHNSFWYVETVAKLARKFRFSPRAIAYGLESLKQLNLIEVETRWDQNNIRKNHYRLKIRNLMVKLIDSMREIYALEDFAQWGASDPEYSLRTTYAQRQIRQEKIEVELPSFTERNFSTGFNPTGFIAAQQKRMAVFLENLATRLSKSKFCSMDAAKLALLSIYDQKTNIQTTAKEKKLTLEQNWLKKKNLPSSFKNNSHHQNMHPYNPVAPEDDPNDPELKGRAYNSFKGKYTSRVQDPWMKSRYQIDSAFLGWLQGRRKRSGQEVNLANLKAEIRNDYVRAGDLWEDYQGSLANSTAAGQTVGITSNDSQLLTLEALEKIERKNKERAKLFRQRQEERLSW